MALEGCDVELSWDIFRLACKIAEALGYFTIDKNTPEGHDNRTDESPQNESFTSKNRKRYEFWYLLQVDCLFRLYFGRPASISEGSWVVNFPDPTISGVDDVSTHFIQIHFLASMRFTLVLLKYLDLVTNESTFHPVEYDKALDKLAVEVKSIMSNWKAVSFNLIEQSIIVTLVNSLIRQRRIFLRAAPRSPIHGFPPTSCSTATKSSSSYKAARSVTSRTGASHPNLWTSPECPSPRCDLLSTRLQAYIGALGTHADDQPTVQSRDISAANPKNSLLLLLAQYCCTNSSHSSSCVRTPLGPGNRVLTEWILL